MLPAARLFAAVVAVVLTAGCVFGQPASRSAPSRPAGNLTDSLPKLAITKIEGVEYVNLDDATKRLGLKPAKSEAGKVVFVDGANRLALEADSREVFVNDLRILLGQKIATHKRTLYLPLIDYERVLAPLFRPALVSARLPVPKTVVIDPGHGGKFAGAENKRLGLEEKDLALDVARRLQKILSSLGYKVVMTRTKDVALASELSLDLAARPEIANRAKADFFVSIHFNSLFPDTKTSGSEIYTFTKQFQRSDKSWGVGQPDDTERDPAMVNRFDAWSTLLGHLVQRELVKDLKTSDRGQKTMHSVVLRGLNCPGVLVESAFLSNEAEAKRVATEGFRQQIAQAIADGIRSYTNTLDSLAPKPTTTTATSPSAARSP